MRHRAITFPAFIALALLTFVCLRLASETAGAASVEPAAQQQRRRTLRRPRASAQRQRRPRIDYSKFSHRTAQHRQACDSCHTIPTPNWTTARAAEPFPDVTDYPDHDACINCHKQQFFRGARPVICTLCHTNVSPRNGARFAFQNPNEGGRGIRKPKSESQFTTKFPHDVHQDVMAWVRPAHQPPGVSFVRASLQQGAEPTQVDSCTICHQTFEQKSRAKDSPKDQPMSGQPADFPKDAFWPEKGTFKTSPTSHASCFNCHWRDGGEKPLANNCVACHELLPSGVNMTTAKTDGTAKAHTDADFAFARAIADPDIREQFLQRKSIRFVHEVDKHEERGCTSCHLTITGADDLKGKTLDVPLLTCSSSSCHFDPSGKVKKQLNTELTKKRADASFSCTYCHSNYGRDPIPLTHAEAVPTPKPK